MFHVTCPLFCVFCRTEANEKLQDPRLSVPGMFEVTLWSQVNTFVDRMAGFYAAEAGRRPRSPRPDISCAQGPQALAPVQENASKIRVSVVFAIVHPPTAPGGLVLNHEVHTTENSVPCQANDSPSVVVEGTHSAD